MSGRGAAAGGVAGLEACRAACGATPAAIPVPGFVRAGARLLAGLRAGLLMALMAGCASPPAVVDAGPWTSGRLALRVAATASQPAQSLTAAFEVQGDAERGELRLNSPLGTRVATARWATAQAALLTPDGERRYESLDALSRSALGEALPLAALPSWLRGRPWPAAPHRAEPDGFEQLGWRVALAALAEGRIEITREAPPQVRLLVRLDDSAAAAPGPAR